MPAGPPVALRPREDRRVRAGHPWIFSNEIASPLGDHAPGDVVDVVDARGAPVGRGTISPSTLIAVRLFSHAPDAPAGPDRATLRARLQAAADHRRRLLQPLPEAHRLVHAEGDFIPGLVVDRYGPVLAVQAMTAALDRRVDLICDLLEELFAPRAVVLRHDAPLRALEGLPLERRVARGHLDSPVPLVDVPGTGMAPLALEVDVLAGQKTGAFLDPRANRAAVLPLLEGGRVLDLFCHEGAWSLAAARAGATAVTGIDASEPAIARARAAAARNGVADVCSFAVADAFDAATACLDRGETYDAVLVDPPAFVRRRARLAEGLKGYRTINERAVRLVRPGGWLVTSSCSHHVGREVFRAVLTEAAQRAGRRLRLLEMRGQPVDHPVLLAAPETEYLKCAVCQVL